MNDFQVQLKVKDEEYVKALKQQAEDVEELLERMRTEFKELQARRYDFQFSTRWALCVAWSVCVRLLGCLRVQKGCVGIRSLCWLVSSELHAVPFVFTAVCLETPNVSSVG